MTESADYVATTPDPSRVEGDAPWWFKVVFVAVAFLPLVVLIRLVSTM